MTHSRQATHTGDHSKDIWIKIFASRDLTNFFFLVRSFEWRGLRLHTWKLVWKCNFWDSVETCLICTGTPAKTCWTFWQSWSFQIESAPSVDLSSRECVLLTQVSWVSSWRLLSLEIVQLLKYNCMRIWEILLRNFKTSHESLKTRREKLFNFSKVSCIAIVYRECSSVLTIVFSNQLRGEGRQSLDIESWGKHSTLMEWVKRRLYCLCHTQCTSELNIKLSSEFTIICSSEVIGKYW